jgi:hypothetical protein
VASENQRAWQKDAHGHMDLRCEDVAHGRHTAGEEHLHAGEDSVISII